LLEKDYEYSIDIWGVGCVFGELIHCSKPYIKKLKSLSNTQNYPFENLLKNYVQDRFFF
jgi:hypothetical protein